MSRFADNHFVEALRGEERMNPAHVRRCLAELAAYKAKRVERAHRLGDDSGLKVMMDELKALVQAMEVYEQNAPPMEVETKDLYERRFARLREKFEGR
jgi:hypothetical protein